MQVHKSLHRTRGVQSSRLGARFARPTPFAGLLLRASQIGPVGLTIDEEAAVISTKGWPAASTTLASAEDLHAYMESNPYTPPEKGQGLPASVGPVGVAFDEDAAAASKEWPAASTTLASVEDLNEYLINNPYQPPEKGEGLPEGLGPVGVSFDEESAVITKEWPAASTALASADDLNEYLINHPYHPPEEGEGLPEGIGPVGVSFDEESAVITKEWPAASTALASVDDLNAYLKKHPAPGQGRSPGSSRSGSPSASMDAAGGGRLGAAMAADLAGVTPELPHLRAVQPQMNQALEQSPAAPEAMREAAEKTK